MTITSTIDGKALCVFAEKQPDGSVKAIGTGCFFIRRDIVLTAKHVIEKLSEIIISNADIRVGEPQKLNPCHPIAYWNHPAVDLALVQIDPQNSGLPERPFYPAHISHYKDCGAIAVGFSPTKSKELGNCAIQVDAIEPYVIETRSRKYSDEQIMEYKAPFIEPGNSGGPILANGGGVIAVTTELFYKEVNNSKEKWGRATSVYPVVDIFNPPWIHGFKH